MESMSNAPAAPHSAPAPRPPDRLGLLLLSAAMVVVGGFAWWLQLQPGLVPETAVLSTLPREIEGWEAEDLPLDAAVESVLRADYNLQRAYVHGATGDLIWLYVGYYGTQRGGRPEHTPRGCYTGAGWAIEAYRTLDVRPDLGLRAREFRVRREQEHRLVHFWFRSHRRTGMVTGLDQNLDRLWGRLLDGRADGALVRVSTPIDAGGEVLARTRLIGFAAALDPLLAERWPVERPAGG